MSATMSDELKAETRSTIRMDAWRSVFEKTNRILSGQKVTVTVVPPHETPPNLASVPGWSDGLDIRLNGGVVAKMMSNKDTLGAVLRLKGLNYHELCHVLYTPRMSDELPRKVMEQVETTGDSTWWYAFNALEDQRIESWFTATYGASKRYFEATVLEWILSNGSAESAILIYGRKYLSPRIRVQAGRVFKKKYDEALYAAFQTVIDEYITLSLPRESIKAQRLVVEYHELLAKMQKAHGAPLPTLVILDNGMGGDNSGHPGSGDADVARKGRVLQKPADAARDKAADQIEDAIDADAEAEAEMEATAGVGSAAGSGDAAGKGKGSGKGSGEGQSDGGADSSADDGSGDSSGGAGASSSGTGSHEAPDGLMDAIRDMVSEAGSQMDEVRADEQVQEEAGAILDAVKAMEQNGAIEASGESLGETGTREADARTKQSVRRILNTITRIRQDAEPETLRRQVQGRIDVRRASLRKPHEIDIFNVWDVGTEEETGMETVLLVDVSGSMQSRMSEATAAMWAFKRAFDRLDVRTTVLLYDTRTFVLWQPGDKASAGRIPHLRSRGGTDPTDALSQAHKILSKSHQPNKVLITVTDGGWGGYPDRQAALMKSMHRDGVVSMLLGLDRAVEAYGAHDHMEAHDINTPSDLPKAALKLVSRIMRSAGMA